MSVSKDLVDIIKDSDSKGTKAYDTPATVTRVDGSTVWVHIPGGVDETPVKKTINAKQGDTVQVRVSGGSAWLNGNASAPPTDDTQANLAVEYSLVASNAADSAVRSAKDASEAAADAKATADSVHGIATQALADATVAKDAADNASEYAARALGNLSTVQSVAETLTWIAQHGTMTLTTDVALDPTHVYFVVDPVGDYIVNGTHYSVVTEPDVADIGTYYELSIDESLNNYVGTHLALTSEGLWLIPEVSGNKVLIAVGGVGHTYTEAGTYIIDENDNISAQFLEDGTTIYGPSGVLITHLGYGPGTDSGGGVSTAPYFTLGLRSGTVGNYSTAEGYNTTADGYASHAEGSNTTASVNASHAEGYYTVASNADAHAEGAHTTASALYSHAEGNYTTASGNGSHAEGNATDATGKYSHAEGDATDATGEASHAEGFGTDATGKYSHAEGNGGDAVGEGSHAEGISFANGDYSHSQNYYTTANKKAQTTLGTYNILDSNATTTHPSADTSYGKYALIIGNGTANNSRSNALNVGWDGDVKLALDTTAASGTIDGDLYAAITTLGWDSDVIVGGN